MSKSIWYIFTFGALGTFILTLFMWLMMDAFQSSPASENTKLAVAIRKKFEFQNAGTVVRNEANVKVLRVVYTTTRDSKFNSQAQQAEMKEVGVYAIREHKSRHRREIKEIRVERREIRGSGCWTRTYTNRLSMENPLLKNELIPGRLPPQFRQQNP